MIPADPDDRDALAGEYVLGLLDASAAAEVEEGLGRDPDLARRVAAWEARLAPLAGTLDPVRPTPGAWAEVERVVAPRPAPSRQAERPPPLPLPARGRGVPGRPGLGRRLWHSAPVWRGVAALATAAALFLAILPPGERGGGERPPRYVALLQARDAGGAETGPAWLIQIGEDGAVRSVPFGRVEPGDGRALQLWTLWDTARGPVSLGVLPPGGAVRLPRETLPVIGGGQLFEITLEPGTGSPTGRPTGRILFIGRATSSETQRL